MRWYVVHAYSGMEKAVERNLRERIDRAGMQDKFGRILVPTEEVVELKNGKKSVTERRFFPGYVLVEMEMDDETWHLVKHTSKVTGFVGGAKNRPAPISEAEVDEDRQPDAGRRREAAAQGRVGGRRAGARQGRPVHRLQRRRRRRELRKVARCACRSRSSAAPRRSNWTSRRSRRFDESVSASMPRRSPGVDAADAFIRAE